MQLEIEKYRYWPYSVFWPDQKMFRGFRDQFIKLFSCLCSATLSDSVFVGSVLIIGISLSFGFLTNHKSVPCQWKEYELTRSHGCLLPYLLLLPYFSSHSIFHWLYFLSCFRLAILGQFRFTNVLLQSLHCFLTFTKCLLLWCLFWGTFRELEISPSYYHTNLWIHWWTVLTQPLPDVVRSYCRIDYKL